MDTSASSSVLKTRIPSEKEKEFVDLGFVIEKSNGKESVATLPFGWSLEMMPASSDRIVLRPCDPDNARIFIVDEKNVPRITIYSKDTFYDSYLIANIVTDEHEMKTLRKEISYVKKSETRKEKAISRLKKLRKDCWSENFRFGVFFVKDNTESVLAGYKKDEYTYYCLGYWERKKDADIVIDLIYAGYKDTKFVNNISKEDNEIITNMKRYKTVNSFEDVYWCA